MLNILFVAVIIAVIAYSMLIARVRRLSCARIRGCTLLISAVLAVVTTFNLRSALVSADTMSKIAEAADLAVLEEFMGISETMTTVVLNCLGALLAPLVCYLLYVGYSILTWVVYMVIAVVLKPVFKRKDRAASYATTRALIWGAVGGIVTVFMLFIPISAYTEIAVPVAEILVESGTLETDSHEDLRLNLQSEIRPADNGVLEGYRALGAGALCDAFMTVEIDGKEISLGNEVGVMAVFVSDILKLSDAEIAELEYSDANVCWFQWRIPSNVRPCFPRSSVTWFTELPITGLTVRILPALNSLLWRMTHKLHSPSWIR